MSSIAVELTCPNETSITGILMSDPKVGQTCCISTGGGNIFRISKIKGWLGPAGGDYTIIFDCNGNKFHIKVIGRSSDFV
jgi:hypothetical protein